MTFYEKFSKAHKKTKLNYSVIALRENKQS